MISLLLAAQLVTASPAVDCSLLTPTQAQGLPCAAPQQPPAADAFIPSAETCTPRPDPYVDGERAAACAAWGRTQRPRQTLPAYEVGAAYVQPYLSVQMIVLGIGSSLEGVPVVTAQYTAGPETGQVFAFRIDQGRPWSLVP